MQHQLFAGLGEVGCITSLVNSGGGGEGVLGVMSGARFRLLRLRCDLVGILRLGKVLCGECIKVLDGNFLFQST